MSKSGIYKITNPLGKIYIGQSIDIVNRWKRYYSLNCKSQHKIYNSLKKYGVDNHKFEIIQLCEAKDLNNLEEYYIQLYQTYNSENGLNILSGGGHSLHTEETKIKIGIANKGRIFSDETLLKMSNTRKGIYPESCRNRNNTLEARKKISEKAKARIRENGLNNNFKEASIFANIGRVQTKDEIRKRQLKQMKITFEQAREIIISINNGIQQKELAKIYNVSPRLIARVYYKIGIYAEV